MTCGASAACYPVAVKSDTAAAVEARAHSFYDPDACAAT